MANKRSGKRASLKSKSSPGLVVWVSRRLTIFIPVFAILFSFGVLQTSLNRAPELWPHQAWPIVNFSYYFDKQENTAVFEGEKLPIPSQVFLSLSKEPRLDVLGETTGEDKWIEVDLSDQKIIAHEGSQIFLESKISSGLAGTPTPTGEFRVWYKTKSQKMSGGTGRSYFYLPNVPFIMFFENENVPGFKGYSLHGTYWHDDFGNRRSHGCVNLPTPVAEQLYYWTTPDLADGSRVVRASSDNPGTKIVIHD